MIPATAQKYVLIANSLRKSIHAGEFGPKGKIPTERNLCVTYQCSRGTIRHALRFLASQGLVRSKRGAGTFAVERKNERTSRRIAAVVPNMNNSEIARFMHVLSGQLIDRGYTLSLYVTNEQSKTGHKIIADLLQSEITGVFKFPTKIVHELDYRARFREAGIPCVVINDFWVDCYQDHHVAYDEAAGMAMAVEHLAGLGHRRIGLLDSHMAPRIRAINAYRDALRRYGLPYDDKLLLLGYPGHDPALDRVYYEGGVNPTALITIYDLIAERVIASLGQMGLKVPEDVSVVNLNGPPLGIRDDIDLTTAVPPNEEITNKALDILEVWTPDAEVRHELIKPGFHVGSSTGPPADAQGELVGAAAMRKVVV